GSDDAVTMRFDRDPVEAVEGVHPSEVELTLDARQLERFGAGDLDVQRALLDGSISHRGPVWKFLRVMPILTTLLRPDGVPSSALAANGATADTTNGSLEGLWAIECRDLHKSFRSSKVLDGVDLHVPEGLISIILGPSGTGKSVLLK